MGKGSKDPCGLTDSLDLETQGAHLIDYLIMARSSHDPQRIERVGESALKILWSDGHESLYAWSLLRSRCPCAACREAPPATADPQVRPLELQPVGRYAMTIRWSDGHTTGIFSHEYLRSICPCEACRPGQFTEG